MTYSLAKVQRQRPVGSEERVETNGQMEAITLPPLLMESVILRSVKVVLSTLYAYNMCALAMSSNHCLTFVSTILAEKNVYYS